MMQKLKHRLNSSDPKMLRQIAHAKINLALQIVAKRDDGYHQLNSFVIFTKFGDKLFLEKSSNTSSQVTLEVRGSFASELGNDDDNLVVQAAMNLAEKLTRLGSSLSPVKITLEKNLPIASGIGGGSADAAATIRLLNDYWQVPPSIDLEDMCLDLGADVPMCLHSKPLIAQGTGETITPFHLEDEFHIVLVNPRVAVSTPDIFTALDFDNTNKVTALDLSQPFHEGSYARLSNDLQEVAMRLHPQIGEVLSTLAKTKPFHFGMSGSGATCFGLYDSEETAQKALSQIKDKNPHYWAIATTTIAS